MQSIKILLFLFISTLFFSCKTPEDIAYFKDAVNLERVHSKHTFSQVFKVDDIIGIYVSASDMDIARPFNLGQGSSIPDTGEANSGGGNTGESSYLIDAKGNIDFPVLGKLKITGLNRVEVKEMISEKIKPFINDPIVNVRLKNLKITVMGEVSNPGSFNIPNERITIIEALGLAGDMTIKGKRNNVIVIREVDGVNTYHRVDFTSKNIFDSPVYYLAQNDVIYVEPNEAQVKSASISGSNTVGIVLSVVGVLLSVLTLVLR